MVFDRLKPGAGTKVPRQAHGLPVTTEIDFLDLYLTGIWDSGTQLTTATRPAISYG